MDPLERWIFLVCVSMSNLGWCSLRSTSRFEDRDDAPQQDALLCFDRGPAYVSVFLIELSAHDCLAPSMLATAQA